MRNVYLASSSSSVGGIGFFGALTVLFVALKLMGVISWSWWWVLAPLWIPWALVVLFFVGVFLIFLRDEVKKNNKKKGR